ncbi:MAG: ABC transporter permease [Clostridia bacterium]|nr:ABC transporter permease [Clostridia bacterium]
MPKRSLLLGVLFLFLSAALLFIFLLYDLARENAVRLVGPMASSVQVEFHDASQGFSLAKAELISDSFDCILSYHAVAVGLCDISGAKSIFLKEQSGADESIAQSMKLKPFSLSAVTSTDMVKDFYSGEKWISEGTGILEEYHVEKRRAVVISKALAECNGWKLHDTVELILLDPDTNRESACSLVIAGLWESAVPTESTARFPYEMAENQIYLPLSVYEHGLQSIQSESVLLAKLYLELKNPSDALIEKLESRLTEIGHLCGVNVFGLKSFSPEEEAKSLVKFSQSIEIAMLSVIFCFGAALFGILFWDLNSRSREVGIYCALGAKRRSVTALFFRENLFLFLVSFVVAVGIVLPLWYQIGPAIDRAIRLDALSFSGTSVKSVFFKDSVYAQTEQLFFGRLSYLIYSALMQTLALSFSVIFGVSLFSGWKIRKVEVMKEMGGAVH